MYGKSRYRPLLAGLLAVAVTPAALSQNPDDTVARQDEEKLALMEKHVGTIESSMKSLKKLTTSSRPDPAAITKAATEKEDAIVALNEILTDHFMKESVQPPESGDSSEDSEYLRQVMIVNIMHIYVAKARIDNDPRICARMRTLIEKLRESRLAGVEGADGASDDDVESKAGEAMLDEMELHVLKAVNAFRKKKGLPPVRLDERLSAAAKDHSGDMQRLNFFSHRSPVPGKTRFGDRAKKFGTSASAENIAQDCKDADQAMKLWVNSQHHRDNILGSYERIGIGRKEGYYTQKFGK